MHPKVLITRRAISQRMSSTLSPLKQPIQRTQECGHETDKQSQLTHVLALHSKNVKPEKTMELKVEPEKMRDKHAHRYHQQNVGLPQK